MASSFPVYAYKITTEPELSLQVGEVEFINVRGLSGIGWTEYKSSNPAVAQVTEYSGNSSSFRVEALGAGTVIITITSTDQRTGEKATTECAVTVTGAAAPAAEVPTDVLEPSVEEVIPVESITIEPGLFFLKIGAERQLNVKIMPLDANAADVIVESYDTNVIDINEKAVVIGRYVGNSEIVAATRDGKVTAKSRVFVGDEDVAAGVYSVFGRVMIESAGNAIPANTGQILRYGDVITTSEVSSARIILPDGRLILINSDVVFDVGSGREKNPTELALRSISLMVSNFWSKTREFLAGESFQVKTPTATCGVRG